MSYIEKLESLELLKDLLADKKEQRTVLQRDLHVLQETRLGRRAFCELLPCKRTIGECFVTHDAHDATKLSDSARDNYYEALQVAAREVSKSVESQLRSEIYMLNIEIKKLEATLEAVAGAADAIIRLGEWEESCTYPI